MITAEYLRGVLNYDKEMGQFTWIKRCSTNVPAGTKTGCINTIGYRVIRINKKLYAAHRLAWLYIHGRWPNTEIDHINGKRDDNRLCNLRECTRSENNQNRPIGSSGLIGARYRKDRNKYYSSINAFGKNHYLGQYDDAASAHNAYIKAKATLHSFNPLLRPQS